MGMLADTAVNAVKTQEQIQHVEPWGHTRERAFALLRRSRPIALLLLALASLMALFTNSTYDVLHGLTQKIPDDLVVAPKQFVSEFTIFVIASLVWIMDRPRRAIIPVLLIALTFSGILNATLKLATGRARPDYAVQLDLDGDKAEWLRTLMKKQPDLPIRMDGADYWLWLRPGRPFFEDAQAFWSFPSGHACTAFVLTFFLCLIYPRAAWLWLLIATTCALSRVSQNRHYPEDIIFGGALGWLVSAWVFSRSWPYTAGRWLLRLRDRSLP